jgi:prolyl-tRNA editing enzyme YbaK/EbsC (Cys-tRNA(Pro) deacylase)
MSVEKAKAHLAAAGVTDRLTIHTEESDTVEHAAAVIGCHPEHIAKTMSFLLEDAPIVIVAAGDAKVKNGKYKAQFGKKATMIPFADVERLVGHEPGGVCPFGVKDGTPVYLDESLKRFETVFPAAGVSNNAVEMTIPELERTSEFTSWVDVTKPIAEA